MTEHFQLLMKLCRTSQKNIFVINKNFSHVQIILVRNKARKMITCLHLASKEEMAEVPKPDDAPHFRLLSDPFRDDISSACVSAKYIKSIKIHFPR